jgi:hypothetical protein
MTSCQLSNVQLHLVDKSTAIDHSHAHAAYIICTLKGSFRQLVLSFQLALHPCILFQTFGHLKWKTRLATIIQRLSVPNNKSYQAMLD